MFNNHVEVIQDILSKDDITTEFKNNIESFLSLSFIQTFGIEFKNEVYEFKMKESLKNKSQLFINTLRLFYIYICKIQKREIDYNADNFIDYFFEKIKRERYYNCKKEIQISRQHCNNTLYLDSLLNEMDLTFELNKKELQEEGSIWIFHSASGESVKDKLINIGINNRDIIVFSENSKNKIYNKLLYSHHLRNEVIYSYLKQEMDNDIITKKTFNFFIALERSFSRIPIASNFNELKSFLKLNNFISIFLDKEDKHAISAIKEYLYLTDKEIKFPKLIENNLRWDLISTVLYRILERMHSLHNEIEESLIDKINSGKHIVFNFSDPLMNAICYRLLMNEIYFSENKNALDLQKSSFFLEQPLINIDALLVSPCSARGFSSNKLNVNVFYNENIDKEELLSALTNSSNLVLPKNINSIKTKKDIIFDVLLKNQYKKIIIR